MTCRLGLVFMLDSNRINAQGRQEDISRLEGWRDAGEIAIHLATTVVKEVSRGNGGEQRRAKAEDYLMVYREGPLVDRRREIVKRIMFPDGFRKKSDENDVEIALHMVGILVTRNKDFLNVRDELAAIGINVMTDAEAVALVERRLQLR